jgi:hypothetical protein
VHNPDFGAARAIVVPRVRPSSGGRWSRSVRAAGFILLTIAFLTPAAGRAQTQTGAARTAGAAAQSWSYTIRAGDTLQSICRAYLRDPGAWAAVGKANGIVDPSHLRVGARLKIPLSMLRTFAGTADAMWTRGDVRAFPSDGAPVTVTAGVRLLAGSRIETGEQAAVLLRLINGALLLVDERSRVVLDDMTVYSLIGTSRTHIKLDSGRIENHIDSPLTPASQYQIKTPVVTTAARGTEFRVSLDGDQRSALTEVVKGRIDVEMGKQHLPLDAGFGLLSQLGGSLQPPKPLPIAPDLAALPARLDRLPANLSWPAVSAVRRYRVRLTENDGHTLIDNVVDEPKIQWQDVPDGSYRVLIRSIDEGGFQGRDAEAALAIHARPEPPLVSMPRHESRVYGGDVDFEWTRSDAATSYDVEIADEPAFARPVAVLSKMAATHYTRALKPGVYFWRIASWPASGERGPFGDPVSFTLRRYPDGREAQAELGKRTLTLRWTAGQPGETAQFEFSRDRSFATHLLDQTTNALQVEIPRPEPGTYFVRVRSIDDQGTAGPFGPIQTIEIPKPPHHWWPWLVVPAAVAGALVVLL